MKRDKKIKRQENMKDCGAETVDCLLLTKLYVNKVLWNTENVFLSQDRMTKSAKKLCI